MMPKKVSGIEDSDRDDANEVTDVANGNDEAVNSEENENKDEVDNEDKDDGEEVGQESAVPPSILIFQYFY